MNRVEHSFSFLCGDSCSNQILQIHVDPLSGTVAETRLTSNQLGLQVSAYEVGRKPRDWIAMGSCSWRSCGKTSLGTLPVLGHGIRWWLLYITVQGSLAILASIPAGFPYVRVACLEALAVSMFVIGAVLRHNAIKITRILEHNLPAHLSIKCTLAVSSDRHGLQ